MTIIGNGHAPGGIAGVNPFDHGTGFQIDCGDDSFTIESGEEVVLRWMQYKMPRVGSYAANPFDIEGLQIDNGNVMAPHDRNVGGGAVSGHCDSTRVPAQRDSGHFLCRGCINNGEVEAAPIRG